MKARVLILLPIVLALFTFSVNAQTQISEAKRALIGELVALTKLDKQILEITDKSLEAMETVYPIAMSRAIDRRSDLTAKQKEDLKATLGESYKSFSLRFRKSFAEKIDFKEYIENSVYPLYDNFYSEQELKDLVAFYKTTTGKKVVETMPQLYAESNRLAQQNLLPQVLVLTDELLKEDLENFKSGAKPGN